MAKKTKRIVYRVMPDKKRGDWQVTRNGKRHGRAPLKNAAVAFGRVSALADWKAGRPSQLVICGQDGKVQTEHTYGNDPKRHKG